MAFTQHGHHIPFTNLGEKRPEKVARCGGVRICKICTVEAMAYMPAFKEDEGGPLGFIERAKELVFDYVKSKLEKTDTHITFGPDEVYVVWFSKTLGNWKALVSTTLPDGMYYEVTYNGDKKETYIDAYKKFDNVAIPDRRERQFPLVG